MLRALPIVLLIGALAAPLAAQEPPEALGDIHVTRASGTIDVDGRLGDPGWQGATKVDTFFETNPGDNVPPKVATVAWLTYDDRFFYVAFELSDPDPKSIRAPFGDRDTVPSYTDYGGVILDTRNDGKTAILFLVNPRNIQYDAITSDSSSEDSSLDLFWDSATSIHSGGWTLEIRIPFSSLRYEGGSSQTWGVQLYRNRPRDFRYQMFSNRLPRGSNCFVCHERKIVGLEGLPSGHHIVLAPYATGRQSELAVGLPGTRLEDQGSEWDGGLDAKWTPNADTAIDATINPDFSQIETDVAQISTNERFALFFPEKRPFFLEGLNLFSTPITAVYSRTITSPRWGLRSTGQFGNTQYTALVVDDRGGGSVILPGPEFSDLAFQDFSSRAAVARARHDFGGSFVSLLLTDREIEGGGHNRVGGPDFEWRPTGSDRIHGQFLLSSSQTPNRPDLAAEWDGRALSSHAAYANWSHATLTWDWDLTYLDIGDDFRADLGFLPQVGVQDSFASSGRSFYPDNRILRKTRPYMRLRHVGGQDGRLILQRIIPGIELQGLWDSYLNLEHRTEKVRAGDQVFDSSYFVVNFVMSPSAALGGLGFDLTLGDDVDFAGQRPGKGATVAVRANIRPTDHLALQLNGSRRWLDVSPTGGSGSRTLRLFTAEVARLKATYTFNARSYLRLIGQRVTLEEGTDEESFSGSALFAYKLNWQTVLYLGYGDERGLSPDDRLEPTGRELFFKISYAFQG